MGDFIVGPISEYKNKLVLVHSSWNDYWDFETLYILYFFDSEGENHRIGSVKIADDGIGEIPVQGSIRTTPKLPDEFDVLDGSFFSLGQSTEYYSNIMKYRDAMPQNPLKSLNDIAFDLDKFDYYFNRRVTKISLLRDVSSTTVKRQFNRITDGGAELTNYNFSYVFRVNPYDINMGENNLHFEVEVGNYPPSNIHVLIGKNGVGKSSLFNNMIESYLNEDFEYGRFVDDWDIGVAHDTFPNLIYTCYSAFDKTTKVNNIETYSENNNSTYDKENVESKYVYLGLRKKIELADNNIIYGTKSFDELSEEFADSMNKCRESIQKKSLLIDSLKMLESDPIFEQANITGLLNSAIDEDQLREFYKSKLSSGHGIILLTVVKLVECVEECTLVLLDEPETHLHPPLLSSFIRCLSELLIKRNAVAIIATHSPVVLQEVPSNCVWVLTRSSEVSKISRLNSETFGESYSLLVEEVFGLEVQKSGFHDLISKEVQKLDNFEELAEKFNYKLGTDAEIIARTLFMSKEKNVDEDS